MDPAKGDPDVALLTEGVTPLELFIASWMVPPPLPVFTVTVHDVPDPLTLLTLAPLTPDVLKVKSEVDNPVMDAAKVAVYCTDAALVVVLVTAVSELMVVLGVLSVPETAWFIVVALVLLKATLPDIVPTDPVPARRT